MDAIVLAATITLGVVLITAVAAVAIVWLTVVRTTSDDLPEVLASLAAVILAIRGKK